MTNPETPMVHCENLVKIYKTAESEVMALQGLDLDIARGEFMAIIGNSGSGKSTFLNMIGALDKPTAGVLQVDGKDLLKFNDRDIYRYKRETVGFVWQNNARNLIPYLTAAENVEVPMILQNKKARRERAIELLEMTGIAYRKDAKLNQMSGGEQQRVAIALALANNPRLLLADEPTGAVDSKTSRKIMEVFRTLNRETGITIIIVTHDIGLSRQVDRVVNIRDGRTSSEFIRRSYAEDMASIGDMGSRDRQGDEKTDSHEEFVVVDRLGRLQLPRAFTEQNEVHSGTRFRFSSEGGRLTLEMMDVKNAESASTEKPENGDRK